MKTYLNNVKHSIINQIKWMGIDNQEDRDLFLDRVIEFCKKEKNKPITSYKSQKTRHG